MSHQYSSPRRDDVHFRLKTATKDLHSRVECVPIIGHLLAQEVSDQDYVHYLLAMYTFLLPLETVLRPHIANAAFPDHIRRHRSEALRLDLSALGVQGTNQYKLCAELPEANSVGEAFGIVYVLEGSLLGGRLIRNHLSRLQIRSDAFHFLSGYGDDTQNYWRTFLASAQAVVLTDPSAADQMLLSAQQTFRRLEAWLLHFPSCLETGA